MVDVYELAGEMLKQRHTADNRFPVTPHGSPARTPTLTFPSPLALGVMMATSSLVLEEAGRENETGLPGVFTVS